MQQFIGCDAHKKFSVFVAVDERGKASRPVRVEHQREVFRAYLESLPAHSEIALESMGSWYWLVDEMERAQHIPHLSLANCCSAHISVGFPFLLRFCDEQSGHSFYPFHCYPGPLARSWRRPFHSCGVPYPQAPTLDRGSLAATIAEFMDLGPHPPRLNGTLGTSHSSAPTARAV
jgi:hypothetical protein